MVSSECVCDAELLVYSFPKKLEADVRLVAQGIPNQVYASGSCSYTLLDGEEIKFPYRIYGTEKIKLPINPTTTQKLVAHAILSRSDNGFTREIHIRELLKGELPDWVFPYILKLSDEYVVEILETIYDSLHTQNCDQLKNFCRQNVASFVRSYDRMASYWGEYGKGGSFHQYVGKKLFRECFGYQRALWRMAVC